MRKTISVLLLAVLAAALLTACASEQKSPQPLQPQGQTGTYADYIDIGATITVQAGDIYAGVARDIFRAAETPEYTSIADMLEAVRMSRADAALVSHDYIKQLQDSGMYSDFDYLWVPEDVYVTKSGPIFHTEELREKYNEWFSGIAADGTWQEVVDRWIGMPLPAQEDIPQFEFTGENGILRVADTGNYPPAIYFDANGEPAGFDVEMISLFAQHMGMKTDFTMMAYEAVISYVISGKADMSACMFAITEERQEGMLFGEPSLIMQAVLIVPTGGGSTGNGGGATPESGSGETHGNGGGSAGNGESPESAGETLSYTDFFGKSFSVMGGSVFDAVADEIFNASEKLYFNNVIDELQAVTLGKVDATLIDNLAVGAMMNLSGDSFKDLAMIEVPLDESNFEYGVFSTDQDIIDSYNNFLREIKENGIYDEMAERWFSNFDVGTKMPNIPLTGAGGTLQVALNASYPPFVFLGEDREWLGFDIEQFYRFAQYLDMDIEFADMDFSALLPYVVSGKADIASSIFITEERRQSVIFGEPDYISTTVIVYRKDNVQTSVSTGNSTGNDTGNGAGNSTGNGFIEWLKTSIQRNLITDNRWMLIVDGLKVTMIIALMAQVFGTVFGAFVCFVLTRKNKFASFCGRLYCGLIHGMPIVVLLMISYYIIFGNTQISNVLTAIAAFSMITGAGVAGNLKGAIDTIDPVEIEAARSIGFSAFKAFISVTLPQAVRRALPGYTTAFVELVKATAVVGYIAIQDLTLAGDIIRSRTYDAYFPLLFVAVIYLIVTTICVQLFKFTVKKMNGGEAL